MLLSRSVCLVAASVVLVACSSGSDEGSPTSTTLAVAAATEPEPSSTTSPTTVPSETAAPSTDAPADTDVETTTSASPPAITAAGLAEVICGSEPVRMDAAAEAFTMESWTCDRAGERARIDLYTDEEQRVAGGQIVLDFYASSGDPRSLAELPLVCGPTWTVGVEFNETRDAARSELAAAGVQVIDC